MSDIEDALAMYAALAGVEPDGTERMVVCVIPGAPVSKSRARYGRGRVYSKPEDVAAEHRTATYLRDALGSQQFPGNVAVGCIFYRPNFQRIDADNLLKHVCDSATGVAWKDDCQVTSIAARMELDRENPRTVVVMGAHRSTLVRGTHDTQPCVVCEKPVKVVPANRAAVRLCSVECRRAKRAVDLSAEIPCAQCGTPFRRKTTTQKLCRPGCRIEQMRDAPKGTGKRSSCNSCGKRLAHKRGGRCRDCWRANPTGRAA